MLQRKKPSNGKEMNAIHLEASIAVNTNNPVVEDITKHAMPHLDHDLKELHKSFVDIQHHQVLHDKQQQLIRQKDMSRGYER
jgi:hypothetical protein